MKYVDKYNIKELKEKVIGKEMFDKTLKFLNYRYGQDRSGGVAILIIETGEYLISIWPECFNSSADLCA